MGVVVGNNVHGWTDTVADRSTRHMVRATVATAEVCNLANVSELKDYATEIERRLDAEGLPEKDTQ